MMQNILMENRPFDIDHRHVETRIVYISIHIFLSTSVLLALLINSRARPTVNQKWFETN